jgi:hypothetical protein
MIKTYLTVLLVSISLPAFAGEPVVSGTQSPSPAADQPSNLTLTNLFTEGWDQAYDKRVTPDGAPDMALLHVQTNFLEREFRVDSYYQQNVGNNKTRDVAFLDELIAYSFDRRFMVEVVSNYEWENLRSGVTNNGASGAILTRLQLVDVPGSSYALNLRVTSPNDGIDMKQTTISPAIAGWQDLTCIGLKRFAVYYDIQEDSYAGPGEKGGKHTDIAYDASLAQTWTDPDVRFFGNFTTFVEFYATTNLNGDERGATAFNVTPGIRFTLGHGNVLMAGVDLPVSQPHDFDATYRLTYIINF